jgi:lysozyme family protein
MADQNFDACLAFVFAEEGGYTDDPLDPGGATNLGITLGELSRWRHSAASKDDVKNLQKPEAAAIYRSNYWNVIRGSELPSGVDLMVFDAAVNVGSGRAAKMLQGIVSADVDGSIGPNTLSATSAKAAVDVINQFAEARVQFYQSLPTFNHFGHGWLARTARAKVQALHLAGLPT